MIELSEHYQFLLEITPLLQEQKHAMIVIKLFDIVTIGLSIHFSNGALAQNILVCKQTQNVFLAIIGPALNSMARYRWGTQVCHSEDAG